MHVDAKWWVTEKEPEMSKDIPNSDSASPLRVIAFACAAVVVALGGVVLFVQGRSHDATTVTVTQLGSAIPTTLTTNGGPTSYSNSTGQSASPYIPAARSFPRIVQIPNNPDTIDGTLVPAVVFRDEKSFPLGDDWTDYQGKPATVPMLREFGGANPAAPYKHLKFTNNEVAAAVLDNLAALLTLSEASSQYQTILSHFTDNENVVEEIQNERLAEFGSGQPNAQIVIFAGTDYSLTVQGSDPTGNPIYGTTPGRDLYVRILSKYCAKKGYGDDGCRIIAPGSKLPRDTQYVEWQWPRSYVQRESTIFTKFEFSLDPATNKIATLSISFDNT